MENLLPQASARDLALIVLKRKRSIVVIFVATMLGFFLWLYLVHSDLYEVDAKVLVKIGREQAPPPSVIGGSPVVIAYRSQDVNSEMQIFASADAIGKVVDELHLDAPVVEPPPPGLFKRVRYEFKRLSKTLSNYYDDALVKAGLRTRLSPREKVIFGLRQGLSVKLAPDSNVFVASLVLPQRVGAARIMNALVDQYLARRQEIYQSKSFDFFRSATASSSAALQQAETQLAAFEAAGGIAQLSRQETNLLDQISAARTALQQAQVARDEASARVERLKVQLARPDPDLAAVGDFDSDSFQKSVLEKLAELQRQRAELRLTDLDSGDRIKNNRQQFDALAHMLATNLETALTEREQAVGLYRADYDALNARLDTLHAKQTTWADLNRHVIDAQSTYRLYRGKLDEASADQAMQERQIGNVAVVERPSDPLVPAGMSKTMLLVLALVGAVLAALVWVTIAEFFDHRVYTVKQLRRHLDVPVLAVISPGLRIEAGSGTKGSPYREPASPSGFSLH